MTIAELAPFVAGFDLGGFLKDGKIRSISRNAVPIDEWPDELAFNGTVYTLERIEIGQTSDEGTWQNAIYC